MTDSIARIKSRAATQARLDLKGKSATRTGKTRKGKLNCTPGNKQCGNRCIPQAWDCRLEGKGTNSELKSHSHDPLGGVASIERGIKTIAKDPTSVQNLDRGRNSIIRGIVKTVPGDNLEKKKQLKRDLQKYGNQIGSALLFGAAVVGAHQSAKRLNKSYARGLGRDIDMAAFGAVDAVLDRTPFIRDRRSAIRGNAVEVSEGLGRAFLFKANKEGSEARALVNRGRIGPLSMPPGQTDFASSGFYNRMQELQRNVRGTDSMGRPVLDPVTKKPIKKIGYEEWVRGSTQALYGAEADGLKGRSIYSNDAANRFVARQFGLAGSDFIQSPGGTRTQSVLNGDAVSQLGGKLNVWGDTMRADMNLRRYETDAKGNFTSKAISKYVDTQVVPNMGLTRGGLLPQQQNIARRQARELAVDILKTKSSDDYKSQARMIRSRISTGYDKYFKEVSSRMGISPLKKESTFGDGQVGLARYLTKDQSINAGRVIPIKSRSHANLILRDYFTTKVTGDKGGTFTSSANTVQRVAQQINGSRELPDVGSAYSIVRESGVKSLRSPSEAPSTGKKKTASKPKKPAKTGLAAQRSQSDLARAIMKRKGFEGSYAEALAQARREMKRSDTAEVRDDAKKSQAAGKPCGNSYIAKSFTCGKGKQTNKTTKEQPELTKIQKVAIAGGLSVTAAVGLALIAKGRLNPPNSSFRNKLQNDALAEYVTDSSYLNRALRSDKPHMIESIKAEIEPIDNWFQSSRPTTGTYYRGIHSKRTIQFLSQAKEGDSYVDKGYGSFSKDIGIANQFTRAYDKNKDIYVLRAKRAPLYRIPVEQFPFKDDLNEQEYLSPRNSRFKISKIEKSDTDSYGRRYIMIDLTYRGVE